MESTSIPRTTITCDEDLIGQIYVGKEELKVRSIGHCVMLEEDAMHIGTEADMTGTRARHKWQKDSVTWIT